MSLAVLLFIFLLISSLLRFSRSTYLAIFILITTILLISKGIPASYDHDHFVDRTMRYESISQALNDDYPAVAPVAPLLKILSVGSSGLIQFAAIVLNCICLILAIRNFAYVFEIKLQFLRQILAIITLHLFIFPSQIGLLVSANKDFAIAFALSAAFLQLSRLSSKKSSFFKGLFLLLVSVYLLFQMRSYFAYFFLATIAINFVIYVFSANSRNAGKIYLNGIFSSLTFCCILLFLKWNDVRAVVDTYLGNATIWNLYDQTEPTKTNALLYPLHSLATFFVYPFIASATNNAMSLVSLFISFYEGLVVFLGTVFLTFLNRNLKLKLLQIFLFCFVHIAVQPWGSPNLGSIFRLRLVESIVISCIFMSMINGQDARRKLLKAN